MSTQAVTPDFIPADQPDFIPDSGHHQVDYSSGFHGLPQPQPQGNAVTRFLKGAGKTYLSGTLNAGPQSGSLQPFTPQEEQEYSQGGLSAQLKKILSDSSAGNVPGNTARDLMAPVNQMGQEIQKDPATGLGSAAMTLLMLRQGFKGNKLPVMNGANLSGVPASQFGPLDLSGANGPRPQLALPAAPIELPASSNVAPTQEGVLPAASVLRRSPQNELIRQYLTRPLREGEAPAVNKDTNTPAQSYFIDKMRRGLEEPTATGETEQNAATARMAELASKQAPAPRYAYRVRDVGETGLLPRESHAQATLDVNQATNPDFVQGRATSQGVPQEVVKIDLSKLDPSEYTIVNQNGQQWVKFNGAVPESFISKLSKSRLSNLQKALSTPQPKTMTTGADLIEALKSMGAKAGD